MANRLILQNTLETILGSRSVYFQPPPSIQMNYPAIVYSLDNIDNAFADNSVYKQEKAYSLTIIDRDPESIFIDSISKLPTCRFNRRYISDNLYHTVFTIYY